VERVVALLRVEADRSGVRLQVDRPDDLPAVDVDASQIEQVLLNVILNAIEASPGKAVVRIHVRLEHEAVIVEVTDEGPGIPPEHMERIFSPFFTTKEKGTGLGLPTAQRIVLAHHGLIQFESAVGVGTVARIRLPMGAAAPGTRPGGAVETTV
jgi:signal transduction histidine kinase